LWRVFGEEEWSGLGGMRLWKIELVGNVRSMGGNIKLDCFILRRIKGSLDDKNVEGVRGYGYNEGWGSVM
jgi:hypothetical protein